MNNYIVCFTFQVICKNRWKKYKHLPITDQWYEINNLPKEVRENFEFKNWLIECKRLFRIYCLFKWTNIQERIFWKATLSTIVEEVKEDLEQDLEGKI
jgi:hypothetical protein